MEAKVAIQFRVQEEQSQQPAGGKASTTGIVPVTRAEQVRRALEERVDKEGMRMVPSLAKEMAKNGWQADLDIFRLNQAARVGAETFKKVTEWMASNNDDAGRLIASHPDLEADVMQMVGELNDLLRQLPRVGTVAYTGRYYQNSVNRDP